jgi:hypothetical protein
MTLHRPMFPPAADSAGAISAGLAIQQRERATALETLARLRKEARAEIERLIDFPDASDPYVQSEAEPDDEGDDSDDEPSLGSFDWMTNQDKACRCQHLWAFPAEVRARRPA